MLALFVTSKGFQTLTCEGNRTSCRRTLRSNWTMSPAVLLKIVRNREFWSSSDRSANAICSGVTVVVSRVVMDKVQAAYFQCDCMMMQGSELRRGCSRPLR